MPSIKPLLINALLADAVYVKDLVSELDLI